MLKRITVKNFKKFKKIDIENLSRINIFVGANNVGKTTLLEAIMAFSCGMNLTPLFPISVMRNIGERSNAPFGFNLGPYNIFEDMMNFFFLHNQIKDMEIELSGYLTDTEKQTFCHSFSPGQIFADFNPRIMGSFGKQEINLDQPQIKINVNNNPNINIPTQYIGKWSVSSRRSCNENELGTQKENLDVDIYFPNINFPNKNPFRLARYNDILTHRDEKTNIQIYSFLKRANIMKSFIKELNECFPEINIQNIENIPYPDGSVAPISFTTNTEQLFPLYTLGDGVRRWYNILGGMAIYHDAIHCIEEVDATFHHEAQANLSKNLIRYAEKYNNQIFMTTHNKEFLNIFLESLFKEGKNVLEDQVRVITLRNDFQKNGIVKQRVLNGYDAYKAVNNGLELRS